MALIAFLPHLFCARRSDAPNAVHGSRFHAEIVIVMMIVTAFVADPLLSLVAVRFGLPALVDVSCSGSGGAMSAAGCALTRRCRRKCPQNKQGDAIAGSTAW
jgi:hypothetical protein